MGNVKLRAAERRLEAMGVPSQPKRDDMRAPWLRGPLVEWSIVGMNHYRMNGERRLFVAMTNSDGRCIQEEGTDDAYLWNRLCHKALAVADSMTPNAKLKGGSR